MPRDLMSMSSRQALNVVFSWWMERIDPDDWEKNWKHLFTSGKSYASIQKDRDKRMKKAEPGESASLNIPVKEPKPVADMSQMFGRMSDVEQ